jgi:hypothetical protein
MMETYIAIPENLRRCALCGERYYRCQCKCTWCGAKLWTFHGRWIHHICSNRKVKGAKQ